MICRRCWWIYKLTVMLLCFWCVVIGTGVQHTDAVPREIRAVVAATRAHTDDAAMIMVVRHFDVRYYGRDTREATMLLRWC